MEILALTRINTMKLSQLVTSLEFRISICLVTARIPSQGTTQYQDSYPKTYSIPKENIHHISVKLMILP